MYTILVAGAGKSSIYLIEYLLTYTQKYKWKVIVADGGRDAIAEKVKKHPRSEIAVIDITNAEQREPLVQRADIVVSLMPPHLHIHLAKDCLKYKKNLITSSYISPEMKAMDEEVKKAGLMFMCEMGLDPGIDHMTANQIIHSIERVASSITSFKSYCGGLIAPESDNNPWHYKFSWNPKNIITAGAGGAKYMHNGKQVEVPYESIFDNCKKIKVDGLGFLAYYPNRDSLRYLDLYEIPNIKTFIRATLRYPSFCKGWNAVIALGLNSETDSFNTHSLSYINWVKEKTGFTDGDIKTHLARKLNVEPDDKVITLLQALGILDDKPIMQGKKSSSEILLHILSDKWQMAPYDKDMVVMQHEVEYIHKGQKTTLTSTMVIKGENREHSAMAKTVGLPMAILTKLLLTDKVKVPTGVLIPNIPHIYRPILTELKHFGIDFIEVVE